MPEGDTIFRAARTLHRALAGSVVTRFVAELAPLAQVDRATPISGRTMVTAFSGGRRITAMAEGHLRATPGGEIALSFVNGPGAVFTLDGKRIR